VESIDQRGRFAVAAEVELIGIRRHSRADAHFLREGGYCKQRCRDERENYESVTKHSQM
jgi:hypothetical protein